MSAIVNNNLGYIYAFPIRIGGIVVLFLGFAIMLTGWLGIVAGAFLAVAGGYFGFTARGINVDLDEKAVRHYTSFIGLKTGKWIHYSTYPFVCVIRKERKRSKMLAESDVEADKPYQYEVHLLSRSHRGRVLLQVEYEREIAERVAKSFAEDMMLEVVEYQSPGRAKKKHHHSDGDEENEGRHGHRQSGSHGHSHRSRRNNE